MNGRTDGKGNDGSNQKLSERRAHRSSATSSTTRPGAGKPGHHRLQKQKLKDAALPMAAENRRVEIVNLVSQVQAQN